MHRSRYLGTLFIIVVFGNILLLYYYSERIYIITSPSFRCQEEDCIENDVKTTPITKHSSTLGETSNNFGSKLTYEDPIRNDSDEITPTQKQNKEKKFRLNNISEYIQSLIHKLQHPKNCELARILLCNVRANSVGFGGNLHSLINCLLQGFVSNRTVIYRSKKWGYAKEGWTYAFQPLSNCKNDININLVPEFLDDKNESRIVSLMATPQRKTVEWIYWSVPNQLAKTLKKLHSDPYAWWIGQFVTYALRLQPWLKNEIDDKIIYIPRHHVGMHVRWGDKSEISYVEKHEVDEYMLHVKKWFDSHGHQNKANRTVYLATVEPSVFTQLKLRYPKYHFIANHVWKANLTRFSERFENQGLENIIADIYLLSHSEFVVCTMSSSICRTVYEMLSLNFPDVATRLQSLDTLHYLNHGIKKPFLATKDHNPANENEIELQKGDKILVTVRAYQTISNGVLRGSNIRTNKTGQFPAFKVEEQLFTYNISHLYDLDKVV